MLTQKIKCNFKRVTKNVNLAARVFTMLKNKIMKMLSGCALDYSQLFISI